MPGAFAKTISYGVYGIEAYQVTVELDVTLQQGEQMNFQIVGLPEGAVRESRDRVRAAIGNSRFWFPGGRITANLAPADIRKEGAVFDLPLAIGVMAASGTVPADRLAEYALVGELGLDGGLRPVRGALPLALGARNDGLRGLVVPVENAREAAVVEGIEVIGVRSLEEVVGFLSDQLKIVPTRIEPFEAMLAHASMLDMAQVRGQTTARRALEVAAAGAHNLIFIGPPGSGKTMLAARLPGILPPMTFEESLETTKIHSIAGLTTATDGLVVERPFRHPHHTVSPAAMIGGGAVPRPGEVSLSTHGVLFLDELPEFPRSVLETLRQPLEDHIVTVSRASMSCTFPALMMLVASMNPCPCGYLTDPARECRCHPGEIQRYHARISGPLLDRIDIHCEVPALKYQELTRGEAGESSAVVRERVIAARERQLARFTGRRGVYSNAQMGNKDIDACCPLSNDVLKLLERAMEVQGFSARAYHRILKVARTIADLAASEAITTEHISEAIHYRSLDREMWRR